MSAADLRILAAGGLPDAVLPACRLEGFGGERFGREAIGAMFARHPESSEAWTVVSGPTSAAAISPVPDGPALFADLHEGAIVRLWRLGKAIAERAPVPTVAVATDDDLSQLRASVFFDRADHDLDDAAVDVVTAAATSVLTADLGIGAPPLRVRAFVRRTVSSDGVCAVLLGLSVLTDGPRRQPLAFNVLVLSGAETPTRLIVDRAGLAAAQARSWTPHL